MDRGACVSYSLWSSKELDMTEHLSTQARGHKAADTKIPVFFKIFSIFFSILIWPRLME